MKEPTSADLFGVSERGEGNEIEEGVSVILGMGIGSNEKNE